MVLPSTSRRKLKLISGSATRDGLPKLSHSFPRPFVEAGHLVDHPAAIAVLQVEELVEVPMEVIGQVGDLLPELAFRVPDQATDASIETKGAPGSMVSNTLGSPKFTMR
jgi:hypothetical protein